MKTIIYILFLVSISLNAYSFNNECINSKNFPFCLYTDSKLEFIILRNKKEVGWHKVEFKKTNDYDQTLEKCHNTVGVAILNTSITIIFGFSILVLSNFIPTIYFGVFTGIAMMLAMISVLTLLPKLILILKPFKNG